MKGQVKLTIKKTSFGIIVGDDNKEYGYNGFIDVLNKKSGIIMGDYVEFEPTITPDRLIATNIKILDNPDFDLLQLKFDSNKETRGYIKMILGQFYIKDVDAKILTKLVVGKYEINIDKNYKNRHNQLVDYKLTSLNSKRKFSAVLVDRDFMPECYRLYENNLQGKVIERVKGGFSVLVFNKIQVFLPHSLTLNHTINIGDNIPIQLINCNDNFEGCVINLKDKND